MPIEPRMRWELDSVRMHWKPNEEALTELLKAGWEPFAVDSYEDFITMHFRRLVEIEE